MQTKPWPDSPPSDAEDTMNLVDAYHQALTHLRSAGDALHEVLNEDPEGEPRRLMKLVAGAEAAVSHALSHAAQTHAREVESEVSDERPRRHDLDDDIELEPEDK